MSYFNRNYSEKAKYFLITIVSLTIVLFFIISYKNDKSVKDDKSNILYEQTEVLPLKEFFFSKIKSPFKTVDYEIKSGDSIQKILKKYEIKNRDIQIIINKYKKYANPNQLLVGNKINKSPLSMFELSILYKSNFKFSFISFNMLYKTGIL